MGATSLQLTSRTPFAANAANGVANPPTSMNGTPFNLSASTATGAPGYQPQSNSAAIKPHAPLTDPAYAFSVSPQGVQAVQKAGQPQSPLQPLGTNDQTNPGYGEQALNYTQNRMLEDPYASTTQSLANQASQPSQGQNYLNQNLGSLQGPGQGQQYWNQVSGQFQDPFAGEQYARQATQNMSPTGPAGAFYNQAMGQYGDFTGYQGPQNAQGQYQQNAASGNLAGQDFYNQVAGNYGTTGTYSGPNLAAGQYGQTQQSFGDLPAPDSADPFYDRSIQLGTQTYNQGAAGRGVYGSSEALSGVGNIITDLNAKRAQTAFGNSMAIAQENRARQQLLGEQARAGDLSSLAGFGANLSGMEAFGNLALGAGNQTLGQQTMLGNQANMADQSAQAAQNSNLQGLSTYGGLASNADTAETNRYTATNNAMNAADRTQIDRTKTGADIAKGVDDTAIGMTNARTTAGSAAANADDQRLTTAANIADQGSTRDESRLVNANNIAQGAEGQRQTRAQATVDNTFRSNKMLSDLIGKAMDSMTAEEQVNAENFVTESLAPIMNDAALSESEKQAKVQAAWAAFRGATGATS